MIVHAPEPVGRPLRIMLAAGEPSGDALGGQLMKRLQELTSGSVTIIGLGGPEMRKAGLQSLFSIDDIAVMGLRDVLPNIRRIFRRARQVSDMAIQQRPDLTVLIDSNDFMRNVAARIKRRAPGLGVIKYVSPQIWASRPGRAKAMARVFDHVLCLFPFEPEFFQRVSLPATFVGNPVVERAPPVGLGVALRERLSLSAQDRIIVMLPGSRSGEVRNLWPIFRDAVDRTIAAVGPATVLIPTVATVSRQLREAIAKWDRQVIVLDNDRDKWGAFEAANVALAASGTVTTELALAATPMVVGYKIGWITAAVARQIMTVKFLNLLNIVLDRRAIPELVQEECTAENLSREMVTLLSSPSARATQAVSAAEALKKLGLGGEQASTRAARAVLDLAGYQQ